MAFFSMSPLNYSNILVKASSVVALAVMSTSAFAGLINPSFETPVFSLGVASVNYPTAIPGWQTTDRSFEIWSDGFLGVTSYDGNQHAEINAFINGTLYQDTSGIGAGQQVGFEFAHRGRAGVDTMALTITDLGIDNILGGGNDTVLFTKQYSTGNTAWSLYNSLLESPIAALGNDIRFAYSAISTASGSPSVGNFLDAADFGTDVNVPPPNGNAPAPATLALLGLGLAGMSYKRRKQNKTA